MVPLVKYHSILAQEIYSFLLIISGITKTFDPYTKCDFLTESDMAQEICSTLSFVRLFWAVTGQIPLLFSSLYLNIHAVEGLSSCNISSEDQGLWFLPCYGGPGIVSGT